MAMTDAELDEIDRSTTFHQVRALVDEVRRLRTSEARLARAVLEAQWAEGRGSILDETGCPWCPAGPYKGEDSHEPDCPVAAAQEAIRARGETPNPRTD